MVESLAIERFLTLARETGAPILDVRTPAEYDRAHLPKAHNLPLFSNEERVIVGTAYKQQGREAAIMLGLDMVGVKMRLLVEAAERINAASASPSNKTLLVHCWRGGMRSGSVGWLLDLVGYKVVTLRGGYKAYRRLALDTIEKPREMMILGGKTGSGKTLVLQALRERGEQVLDLEALAHHKGSAFGALGEEPPPTQEEFENRIGTALWEMDTSRRVWIEDESRMVGRLMIPATLWEQMRIAPTLVLEVPTEERLRYLAEIYGEFTIEELKESVLRIQKRLGGAATKGALEALDAGNLQDCAALTLHYYDSTYAKGLSRRDPKSLSVLEASAIEAHTIAERIVQMR
jgi:tRNA 2-selenouridine synthase